MKPVFILSKSRRAIKTAGGTSAGGIKKTTARPANPAVIRPQANTASGLFQNAFHFIHLPASPGTGAISPSYSTSIRERAVCRTCGPFSSAMRSMTSPHVVPPTQGCSPSAGSPGFADTPSSPEILRRDWRKIRCFRHFSAIVFPPSSPVPQRTNR